MITKFENYNSIKGLDVIHRDIPDWTGAEVYHTTSEEYAKDIETKGYRFRKLGEDAQNGYYGKAISFTTDLEYSRNFGDITTVALILDGSRILNLNDPKDWDTWIKLTQYKFTSEYYEIAIRNNIDGVYDAGAGDLFIYNPKIVKYQRTING